MWERESFVSFFLKNDVFVRTKRWHNIPDSTPCLVATNAQSSKLLLWWKMFWEITSQLRCSIKEKKKLGMYLTLRVEKKNGLMKECSHWSYPFHKKETSNCHNYRTKSLIGHPTKVVLQVIQNHLTTTADQVLAKLVFTLSKMSTVRKQVSIKERYLFYLQHTEQ